MIFIRLLLQLVCGHALADFAFQSDVMAREKNRHSTTPLQRAAPWYYWMTAHALIHAGMVYQITGSLMLAGGEFIIHFLIDAAKCEGKIGIASDQFIHILCKVIWALVAARSF